MTCKKYIGVAVLLCASGLYVAAQNEDLADFTEFKRATVATAVPSNLPISFHAVKLQADSLRQLFRVSFRVQNKGVPPIEHATYAVYVVTPDGNTVGGESFPARGAIRHATSKHYQVTLHNIVPRNGRLILAVNEAVSNGSAYLLPADLILDRVKNAGGPDTASAEAIVETATTNAKCSPDSHQTCFEAAKSLCSAGIKSFSCDAQCHCSFTCK